MASTIRKKSISEQVSRSKLSLTPTSAARAASGAVKAAAGAVAATTVAAAAVAPSKKKRLVKIKSEDFDAKTNIKTGVAAGAATDSYDHGQKIADAIKADLKDSHSSRDDDSAVVDGHVYRDPAPLKWRIFEAAKENGHR